MKAEHFLKIAESIRPFFTMSLMNNLLDYKKDEVADSEILETLTFSYSALLKFINKEDISKTEKLELAEDIRSICLHVSLENDDVTKIEELAVYITNN